MPPNYKTLIAVLASLVTVPLAPAVEELTETQKAAIIKRLDELLNRRDSGATSGAKGATTRLKAAAASDSAALAFYIECIKRERFERDEKKGGEFPDWKKSHTDAFRQDAVGLSLRAHMLGMATALEVAAAEKIKNPEQRTRAFLALLPDVHAFIDLASAAVAETAALAEDRNAPDHRRNSDQANRIKNLDIFNSEVADALNVTAYIKIPEGFPSTLNAAEDATESFLLPRLYEIGQLPPIDEAWDRHIARLADGVNFYKKEKLIAKSKDLFEEDLPLARWAQARDRYTYGTDKVAGATAMLEVIKTHLDHEFCVTWIEEFKEVVEQGTPEPLEADGTAGL